MTHKTRLGAIVIDCQTNDLSSAATFWGAALGQGASVDADGHYGEVITHDREARVLLQRVDHPSRVHIDIETDDREAEAARLEALGAIRVGWVKEWIVMDAPTGHRFCIVSPQRADFEQSATATERDT